MELKGRLDQKCFRDAAQMKNDADLDPIRARPDFKELLKKLETPP